MNKFLEFKAWSDSTESSPTRTALSQRGPARSPTGTATTTTPTLTGPPGQNWPESKSTGEGTVGDHNTCLERTALIHLRPFNVRGAAHADHHQEGYPSGPDGAGEQRGRYCRPPDSPTVPGEEDDRAGACARHSTTSAAHRNGKREDYPR